MGKPVNMYSFIEIIEKSLEMNDYNLVASMLRLSDESLIHNPDKFFSKKEVLNFYNFAKEIVNHFGDFRKSDNYYIGYSVPIGISKEFDILRFSDETIINIELKDELPDKGLEAIKSQLIKNRYFLKVTGKEVILCTYVDKLKKIYHLTNENELMEISFKTLGEMLPIDSNNSNELSNQELTDFIISPYSETEKFIDHTYFLTDNQITKKKYYLTIEGR